MNGVDLIRQERRRQRAAKGEGWSLAHDDGHTMSQLAIAAAVYAMPEPMRENTILGRSLRHILWPWESHWFRPTPKDRVRELVKAGALIAAEIDRLQRRAANSQDSSESAVARIHPCLCEGEHVCHEAGESHSHDSSGASS